MKYQELKVIHYNDRQNVEKEYQTRLEGFGTIKTDLMPYLMYHHQLKSKEYPLFTVSLPEIQLLSESILLNAHEIKEISEKLPRIAHQQFYNEQLFKSIIATNEIEGVKTSRRDVELAFVAAKQNKKEKVRLLSTIRMYHDVFEEDTLSINSLSNIHDIYEKLSDGEIEEKDQIDGKLFRNGTVSVVDVGKEEIAHIAPTNEIEIEQMLTSWLTFINDKTIPFLIKASLGHYFFENIHPFYDGNGRTGRYILSKYLARKLDKFTGLVLSQKIKEEKTKYYKAFEITGNYLNRAEGTFFVLRLLNFINEGQMDILQMLKEKQILLERLLQDLRENKKLEEVEKFILSLLIQSKIFTDGRGNGITDNEILDLSVQSTFSKRSVKAGLQNLATTGMIELVNQRPLKHEVILESVCDLAFETILR